MSIKIIAEIGINHNGSIDLARKLIDMSICAGFDYVKFQKRTPELCVPDDMKNKTRNTIWGEMTYLDYRNRIELCYADYVCIDKYCKREGIQWFASAWDVESAKFLKQFGDVVKIPSACLTNDDLLRYCRQNFRIVILSTGMSAEYEITKAISLCNPDVIMHTNSCYPSQIDEINLNYIHWLKKHYHKKEIGYSGHEYGLTPTFAAAAMGVDWIERHVTLDHNMQGSDHLASVDPVGMIKLVRGVRDIERSMGYYGERIVWESEKEKRRMLRK